MSINFNDYSQVAVTITPEGTSLSASRLHFVQRNPVEPSAIDFQHFQEEGDEKIIIQANCAQWIQAHPVAVQSSMEEVLKAMEFISIDRFKMALKHSCQNAFAQLNAWYPEGFDAKEHAIILVEGGKSNKWVAELALRDLKAEPFSYVRLGDKNAQVFQDFFERLKAEQMRMVTEAFKDKTIILFDDGSYSGKQLADHLCGVKKTAQKHRLAIKGIALIVPYMTAAARAILAEESSRDPAIPVIISHAENIRSLADLSSATQAHIRAMWYPSNETELPRRGLIWLQHKVPNDQSFPAPLARGSVYGLDGGALEKSIRIIPDIIPPYKYEPITHKTNLPNFHSVGKRLYRGGLPSLAGYQTLKTVYGITTIITLRQEEPDHASLITMGLKVVHLPMDAALPLPKEHVKACIAELRDKAQTVFVHCYHGSDRTGALIAAIEAVETGNAANAINKHILEPKYGFHRLTHGHFLKDIEAFAADKELRMQAASR